MKWMIYWQDFSLSLTTIYFFIKEIELNSKIFWSFFQISFFLQKILIIVIQKQEKYHNNKKAFNFKWSRKKSFCGALSCPEYTFVIPFLLCPSNNATVELKNIKISQKFNQCIHNIIYYSIKIIHKIWKSPKSIPNLNWVMKYDFCILL